MRRYAASTWDPGKDNYSMPNMPYLYADMITGFKRLEQKIRVVEEKDVQSFLELKQENAELKNKLNRLEQKLDSVIQMLNNELQPGS